MTVLRLLLVDDEPLILATFKHGLRVRGYDVATADSGEAALAAASAKPFDMAILDIRMPGMSGLDLGRLLLERHNLPSLYLTAICDDDYVTQAVRVGALTYLVKPVDVAQLIPAIETAWARTQEIRALAEQKAHLDLALKGRRHTSVAIGILMEQRRLTEQQAFEMLRSAARRQRRKLEDYCTEIIKTVERNNAP
jgi:AmiR/NasT family two-component response regulator